VEGIFQWLVGGCRLWRMGRGFSMVGIPVHGSYRRVDGGQIGGSPHHLIQRGFGANFGL
jgi:hypothetical protein